MELTIFLIALLLLAVVVAGVDHVRYSRMITEYDLWSKPETNGTPTS